MIVERNIGIRMVEKLSASNNLVCSLSFCKKQQHLIIEKAQYKQQFGLFTKVTALDYRKRSV